MTQTSLEQDATTVCELIERVKRHEGRTVIAIAGPPGSGKSTLAERVVAKLNGETPDISGQRARHAVLLPMDGYHLDNRILKARGLLAKKGAPETFDAHGFCHAVAGLHHTRTAAYFPIFDRGMDLAIAGAIEILPKTPIVVVEGNYLLLGSQPWAGLKDSFAASVFVKPDIEVLRARLCERWIVHGLDPEAAIRRAEENDLANARLVLDQSAGADLELHQL